MRIGDLDPRAFKSSRQRSSKDKTSPGSQSAHTGEGHKCSSPVDHLDPHDGGLSIGKYLNLSNRLLQPGLHRTVVGIDDMSAPAAYVISNFTADHDAPLSAVRLSHRNVGAMSGPHLLINLVKGWPRQDVRREVVSASGGIDRLGGEKPARSRLGPSFGPRHHSRPTI